MTERRMMFALVLVQLMLPAWMPRVNAAGEGAKGLNYRKHGLDWPGLCQSGRKQSPIRIKTQDLKPHRNAAYAPQLESLGVAEDLTIFLTPVLPHVELEWERMTEPARATLAATKDGDIFAPLQESIDEADLKRVAFEPSQFHFHTPSENSLDGKLFDGVIHVVNFVKEGESKKCDAVKAAGGLGCPVVVSIFLQASDAIEASPLAPLFTLNVKATGERAAANKADYLIRSVGEENGVEFAGAFDLNSLLPNNGSVATWDGSLTTAPCTEGVFWIQFLTPLIVSPQEIQQLRKTLVHATGPDCKSIKNGRCFPKRFPSNNRVVQRLNGRVVRRSNALSKF